jgi:hypothetical protein
MPRILNRSSADAAPEYTVIEPGVFIFSRKDYFRLRYQLTEESTSVALSRFYAENLHHLEGALRSLPSGEADILRAFLMASWRQGFYGTKETASTLNGYHTGMTSRDGIALFNLSPSYTRGCMQRLHEKGLLQKLAVQGEGGRASKIEHFFLVAPKNIAGLFDFGTERGERGWSGLGIRRAQQFARQTKVSTPIQVALYKIHDVLDAAIGYGREIVDYAVKKINRARRVATEAIQCFAPPTQGGKRLSTSAGGIQSSEYFVFFTEKNTEDTINAAALTSRAIDCKGEDVAVTPPLIRRRRVAATPVAPTPQEAVPPTQTADPIVARLAGTVLGAKVKTYAATLLRGERSKAKKKLAKALGAPRATDPLATERAAFQARLDAACDAVGVKVPLRVTASEFGALYKNQIKTGALPDLEGFLHYTLSTWEMAARQEAEAVKRKMEQGHKGWEPLSPAPNTADLCYRASKLIRSYHNRLSTVRVVAVASVSDQQQENDRLRRELQEKSLQVSKLSKALQAEREVAQVLPKPVAGAVTSAPSGFRYDDDGFLQPTE